MKPDNDLKRRHQIVTALKSGWMKESSIAKRLGISRQWVRHLARDEGVTSQMANDAFEARQDKIWEEIKRKVGKNGN